MGFGPVQLCDKLSYIENSDGTVSAFKQLGAHNFIPAVITEQCCSVAAQKAGKQYTFDANTQKCLWKTPVPCNIENKFNITLNPIGDDGNIFYITGDENCSLVVDFDYLFNFNCQKLLSILNGNQNTLSATTQTLSLTQKITDQRVLCETLANEMGVLEQQIESTPYSIACTTPQIQPPTTTVTDGSVNQFSNTGFNTSAPNPTPSFSLNIGSIPQVFDGTTYCLTEDGLAALANILGPNNYADFLAGINTSYTCANVVELFNQNQAANNTLMYECNVPFGTKTSLIKQLNQVTTQHKLCNTTLSSLESQLTTLLASQSGTTSCDRPISVFENLDVSLAIDVVNTDNTLTTVYETNTLFPKIGIGNLYSYLTSVENSGFYVCQGTTDCEPMTLDSQINNACKSLQQILLSDLFIESGLSNTPANITVFNDSLSNNIFASNWLHFSQTINDTAIISKIANKKIKLTIKLNHTCTDVCILLDNIKLDKECSRVTKTNIFVTECPGFELDKIRDNKKSWINNTSLVNRDFKIYNTKEFNPIRQTNYNTEDERLVLNSKEIDLDINLAAAIETDVWCYISDNPCLLTGVTTCDPCLSACSGDNKISFTDLMTQPLSAVTVVEDFEYYLLSELIDAKNRQTISGYPTLRALYDRYMSSSAYCGSNSSAFDYMTMDKFAGLVGNYWVDIVEQVIPSTTIWGSVKIYSNTIFDQQKFKYKSYSTLFCGNPFSGETLSNPINGTSGQSVTVGVDLQYLTTGATWSGFPAQKTLCNVVSIAQMNNGSEFIGNVDKYFTRIISK